MSLDEFKTIYWWEWSHRFLGRLIGMVFLVPFLVFLSKGWISRPLLWWLIALFLLGGLQAALGWFMVQSGLSERIDVSQYRLVAHLGLAFLIFAFAFWLGAEQLRQNEQPSLSEATRKHGHWAVAFLALLYMQILLGGFVAGTDAGLVYNTWPLMDGGFVPAGLFQLEPWYANFFENVTTIQFQHRLGAYAVAIAAAVLWWRGQKIALSPRARLIGHHVLGLVALQVAIGILTLIFVAPLFLSAIHQAMAIALFATSLLYAFELLARRAL
jgi:cytochrome c oxidase assembly protein subunit 15